MLLPLVPLRDVVIFPGVVTPLFVGRDKSINALQKAMADDKSVMLIAQFDFHKLVVNFFHISIFKLCNLSIMTEIFVNRRKMIFIKLVLFLQFYNLLNSLTGLLKY